MILESLFTSVRSPTILDMTLVDLFLIDRVRGLIAAEEGRSFSQVEAGLSSLLREGQRLLRE